LRHVPDPVIEQGIAVGEAGHFLDGIEKDSGEIILIESPRRSRLDVAALIATAATKRAESTRSCKMVFLLKRIMMP
jgi:hypothetical protein